MQDLDPPSSEGTKPFPALFNCYGPPVLISEYFTPDPPSNGAISNELVELLAVDQAVTSSV